LIEWKSGKAISGLIVLLISAILGPILVYEYINRPIINYELEGVDSINFDSQNLVIQMLYRNRGKIHATIVLVLTTENATIKKPESLPAYIIYNETKTRIRVYAVTDMETYGRESLGILPKDGVQTFSISMNVEKPFDFGSIFWEPKPTYPATLTYNKTGAMEYARIP
jgi:hypothetical protein